MLELSVLTLVLIGLATARITRLITRDTMPIVSSIRDWFKERFPADGDYVTKFIRYSPRILKRKLKGKQKPRYRSQPTQREGVASFYVTHGHWFGKLISCDWCAGFWVSLGMAIWFIHFPAAVAIFALPWALSEITGLAAGRE